MADVSTSSMAGVVTQAIAKSFGLTEENTSELKAIEAAVNQLNKETLIAIYELRKKAMDDGDNDWAQLMLDFGKSLVPGLAPKKP